MKPCCEKQENLVLLKAYDPKPRNEDGSVQWYLFRWDDGKDGYRRLMKCRRCATLFLVQAYQLHKFSKRRETVFEDWYLVDSERQADFWNRKYTGVQLEHCAKPAMHREIPGETACDA